jgi:hypothetical protein
VIKKEQKDGVLSLLSANKGGAGQRFAHLTLLREAAAGHSFTRLASQLTPITMGTTFLKPSNSMQHGMETTRRSAT